MELFTQSSHLKSSLKVVKKSDEGVVKAKGLFDHLSGITNLKTPWESLSVMDKKSFETYMVNRFLSMGADNVEIVNIINQYTNGQLTPREVYKFYLDILPKKKSFNKYIKGKSEDKWHENVIQYFCKYYEVSSREVLDYLDILTKDEIKSIIVKYGIDPKEIDKWLK